MAQFDLKDAIDLLYKQTDTINSLWNTYSSAAVASAGLGTLVAAFGSAGKWDFALVITAGFVIFAIGNGFMLRAEIKSRSLLAEEIGRALSRKDEHTDGFNESLRHLVRTTASVSKGVTIHVLIDLCVVAAILLQVLFLKPR